MNKNALKKDFTPFCDENCKKRTQIMVDEDIVCTFYIPSNMQRLKCTDQNSWGSYILDDFGIVSDLLDLIDCCKRE